MTGSSGPGASAGATVGISGAVVGWAAALKLPNVRGLVIGRSLLFPRDGDVAAAVDQAVALL